MDYLLSVFGDDREFFSDLFRTYYEDNSSRMKQLHSKLEIKDADAVEQLAHSIKGASGNIGAEAMKEFATELETMGRESQLGQAPSVLDSMNSEFEQIKTYIDSYINA
jgi:HPt (histidine-containing phosphotransfer) domain-containing protein